MTTTAPAPTVDPASLAVRGPAPRWACVDANEATASVAHRLSELCALYPITPASPMGEHADVWSHHGRTNVWGRIPRIVQMQSEAGAAGTLHGALQAGLLATSFTSSQGLLLMLPNMFKIAGELTPAVLHVAARAVATHALSIFGDHSDVMAARSTGWAMLCSASAQEAHDMAAVAHAATLSTRLPFVHFFDGFRTSHEITKVALLPDDTLRALVDEDALLAHRARCLSPARPVLRGTAQNPDVFFQSREAANPYYAAAPDEVARTMARLFVLTGRRYGLVEYHGAPDADRVVVAMGSAVDTLRATADALGARGERVGVLAVRLFRPFPAEALRAALPSTVRAVAVLDRVKEPGAVAEPLHLDVVTSLAELAAPPQVIGGRYGLGSKEFTPGDAAAVFAELGALVAGAPVRRRFTVGIDDDVTGLSLPRDGALTLPSRAVQAVFYGLGSDGTVGANKATITLIGEHTDQWVQGYFVYDSKKAGSTTVSHLRFGPDPIAAPYLVEQADFVGVHQFAFLGRLPVLDVARPGATVLLAAPVAGDQLWGRLPVAVQRAILDKGLDVHVVNASKVARRVGLGGRINTVMQACFFALAGVLPVDEALALAKERARATYGKRGPAVVEANVAAIDAAVAAMTGLVVPEDAAERLAAEEVAGAGRAPDVTGAVAVPPACQGAADLLGTVRRLIAGEGELLPVSAMPADGTFPTGTSKLEKRGLATELPVWEPANCIDCGRCALACPHAAIRLKAYDEEHADAAPAGFASKPATGHDMPLGSTLTVQVSPDDCTGCSLCAKVCPASALTMSPARMVAEPARRAHEYFQTIPDADRTRVRSATVAGSQLLTPLFEFSGACSGCGQTPYVKLVTQLLGDRMVVANATGCSSIYGGNLPTTPWTTDAAGRGPAWSNSLFEDNAEFGLGLRLGASERAAQARALVAELAGPLELAADLVDGLVGEVRVVDETQVAAQRRRVERLREALAGVAPVGDGRLAGALRRLDELADALVPVSVWIIGGDGWAYDIGFGGLDHVLASGEDVNVLVLDSEVYSNTGGQASKATPVGASAKFAAGGKTARKKDLGLIAQAYGGVYVAQVSLGADDAQTLRAIREAAAHPGPSLVIAYAACREQGIDLGDSIERQRAAVASGHWLLYRYQPEPEPGSAPVLALDMPEPSMSLADFYAAETRFRSVARADPQRAADLLAAATAHADERLARYRARADER